MNSAPTPIEDASNLREAFAQHIADRKSALLKRWREHTVRDPHITTASRLARIEFEDHIPQVLEAFCNKLRPTEASHSRAQKKDERDAAEEHGSHRWQQGYGLQEMVREWGLLNVILVEEIDEYAVSYATACDSEVLPAARRALAEMVNEGVSDSVAEFSRLQQAEAHARARDLESALEHLQSLARERGEMLRRTSHDLRGGLSVVQGAASLLDEDYPLSEGERDDMVQMVQSGVDNLGVMLNAMLDLARLEAGHEEREVELFDAAALLKSLGEASKAMARSRGLSLHLAGPETLPVSGDRVKVQRIAQNLLLNALKYTENGDVFLQWREGAGDENETKNDGERWTLSVSDTGPGMPRSSAEPIARELKDATDTAREIGAQSGPDQPETPRRAAWSTPDGSSGHPKTSGENNSAATHASIATATATMPGGEGIGLSIVKRLCELLDATLELDSAPNRGSTFRVVFPMKYE